MNFSVVASSPSLELSGANVLVANLLNELHRSGVSAGWIVTAHTAAGPDARWLGQRSFGIDHLPPTRVGDVRQRQALLLKRLEEHAPCIFVPNFDFDMTCAIPAMSAGNSAVMIVHCDDAVYYRCATSYGKYFNAIVCVSEFLTQRLRAACPKLRERILHIPFGVQPPVEIRRAAKMPGDPIRVAYCGRISFYQKRVQDLAEIINRCHAESLPVQFSVAGAGPDEERFFELVHGPLSAGTVARLGFLPNDRALDLLAESDVLVMTSEFEGLPVVLLEAMSRGCVPVVTQTQSGMGEVVQHTENGFLLPVGDIAGFLLVLRELCAHSNRLLQLQNAAARRITEGGFTLERAAQDYRRLFESLVQEASRWPAQRTGRVLMPKHYRLTHRLGKNLAGVLERICCRATSPA